MGIDRVFAWMSRPGGPSRPRRRLVPLVTPLDTRALTSQLAVDISFGLAPGSSTGQAQSAAADAGSGDTGSNGSGDTGSTPSPSDPGNPKVEPKDQVDIELDL